MAERGNHFDFFVTDHTPDDPSFDADVLKNLYVDIKESGIASVRYDWRWENIEPQEGVINSEALDSYRQAAEIMGKSGLKEPTVVLSSIPKWARKLYKGDKKNFFYAIGNYLEIVGTTLATIDNGMIINRVQILNELNTNYSPIKEPDDIVEICGIARRKLQAYNPNINISVSIVVAEFPKIFRKVLKVESIKSYIPKLEHIKDYVDTIIADFYPGSYQRLPLEQESGIKDFFKRYVSPREEIYKEMFMDFSLFTYIAEKISSWGMNYEIGETGFPTKGKYWGNERRQRYYYNIFLRNLKHLMLDFQERGIRLPSRIGLYQAADEIPNTLKGKILKHTPYPEFSWGMRTHDHDKKLILRGQTRNPETGEPRINQLIHYLNSPIKRDNREI